MERPDYSLQTWGDAPKSSPQNSVFIDPNKSIPYVRTRASFPATAALQADRRAPCRCRSPQDKQGDPVQANDADEGSRGRVSSWAVSAFLEHPLDH